MVRKQPKRKRLIDITVGIEPDQLEKLDALAYKKRTRRPALVRQSLDLLFLAENIQDEDIPVSNKAAA